MSIIKLSKYKLVLVHNAEVYGVAGPHEMNELVMDSTHTTFLISRRTTFRKGVPHLVSTMLSISDY